MTIDRVKHIESVNLERPNKDEARLENLRLVEAPDIASNERKKKKRLIVRLPRFKRLRIKKSLGFVNLILLYLGKLRTPSILGALIGIGSGFLVNQSQESFIMFESLDLIEIAIIAAVPILTFISGLFIKSPTLLDQIEEGLTNASEEVVKAIQADSEGGKKITPNEVKAIIKAAL